MNKKPNSQRKSDALRFRISKDEGESFNQYCEKNDIKKSRLLRKVVREIITNEPDLLPEEMEAFKDAVRQLAGISRNLNQITRKVNSGACPTQLSNQGYWDDLGDYVKAVRHSLDEIIDKTENRWVAN